MKNIKLCGVLVTFWLPSLLAAQIDTLPPTHLLKHSLFVCGDTAYELTRVLDDDFQGLIFQRGYLCPGDSRYEGLAVTTTGQGDRSSFTRIAHSALVPEVDTLRALFPYCRYSPPVAYDEGDMKYMDDLLTEDAFLTFALRTYGLLELDTGTTYYFGPVDESVKDVGKQYVLCMIDRWQDPSPRFQCVLGRLTSEGFAVGEVHDLKVPRKVMQRIGHQLDKFVKADWNSCVAPGGPGTSHLLVAGGKKVSRTDYCEGKRFRHNRLDALTAVAMAFRQYGKRVVVE